MNYIRGSSCWLHRADERLSTLGEGIRTSMKKSKTPDIDLVEEQAAVEEAETLREQIAEAEPAGAQARADDSAADGIGDSSAVEAEPMVAHVQAEETAAAAIEELVSAEAVKGEQVLEETAADEGAKKPDEPLEIHQVESRFTYVVLAAKRAKQILEGAPPFISTSSPNPLTTALQEVAQKKVTYRPAGEKTISVDDE